MGSKNGFTGNVSPSRGGDKRPVVGATSVKYRDADTLRRAKAAAGMLGISMGDFIEGAINERARGEFKNRGLDLDAILAEERAAA